MAGGEGDPRKAVDLAQRAGNEAISMLAYEEAMAAYQRALQLLELQHPEAMADRGRRKADMRRRCELLLALADATWRAGQFARAAEVFPQAASLARLCEAPQLLARAALGLGMVRIERGGPDRELVDLLEESLRSIDPGDLSLRSRLLARLARSFHYSRQAERRSELILEAVAAAERVSDDAALAEALLAQHVLLVHS